MVKEMGTNQDMMVEQTRRAGKCNRKLVQEKRWAIEIGDDSIAAVGTKDRNESTERSCASV